jgi:hypothetical protein
MMIYAQYLMDRYLGKKGQGLTEYAIILLLVVAIGLMVWTNFNIKGQIQGFYQTISTDLGKITTSAAK